MDSTRKRPRRIAAIVGLVVLVASLAIAAPDATAASPEPPPRVDESTAYQLDAAHAGSIDGTTQRPPLVKAWTRDLGGTVSYPVVTAGRVFAVARNAGSNYGTTLYAIDAETGDDVWGPIPLGGTYYWSGITAGDGRVYALTFDGILRAYDQATGHLDWIEDLPGQYAFSSEPTFHDGIVYSGGAGSGGTVYATDAADGDLLWTAGVANGDHSSPAVTDGGVYVSYACEQTYAFQPVTGSLRWHHSTSCSGGGGRTPVVAEGQVWVRDDAIMGPVVLDADTGDLTNTFASTVAPAFHDGTGFFLEGSTLHARNASTLAPLWSFAGDGHLASPPIVVNGYVYAGSTAGKLYALDEHTGQLAWSGDVGAPVLRPDEHDVSSPVTGLGAGSGLIVVPASNLLVAFASAQSRLVPVTPSRLLDTRPNGPMVGYSGQKPGAGTSVSVPVLGHGGVPAVGVAAVVLTVTATQSTAPGHVTAWPTGQPEPLASALNVERTGQTIANQVIVPVGADGTVSLRTTGGGHLVADVTGYFAPAPGPTTAGRFVPADPARVLDTRSDGPRTGYSGPKPSAGTTVPVQITGVDGVPVSGVSAVAINLTATQAAGAGFVTAWASGARPLASSVNMDYAGQTIAASVTVPVGPDGTIQLYTPTATHLVVDVAGYYTDGTATSSSSGLFVPVAPVRAVDTRSNGPMVGYSGPKPAARSTVAMALAGTAPASAEQVGAVVFNLTATETGGGGFVTVHPHGSTRPLASNLNIDRSDQTIPNLVVVPTDDAGWVDVYTYPSTHLVADVSGYFLR